MRRVHSHGDVTGAAGIAKGLLLRVSYRFPGGVVVELEIERPLAIEILVKKSNNMRRARCLRNT